MAPTWRLALSLDQLRAEVNRSAPARSKASDGTIGDAAHAARTSDHNPWVRDEGLGVVTALDLTHDPAHGFNAAAFAEWLRLRCKTGREKRVKYIISNRRIASAINAWAWRPYDGLNAHKKHCHVSVLSTKSMFDSKAKWTWGDTVATPKPAPKPTPPAPAAPAPQGPLAGPGTWPKWKLTAADARALGDPRREGEMVAWSVILRSPPAVAQLRREHTAAFGALTGLIGELAARSGGMTAGEAEAAAKRGAELALEDLGRRLLDDAPD